MRDLESTTFLNSRGCALLYSENTSPGCTSLRSQRVVAEPPKPLPMHLRCMFAVFLFTDYS